MRKQRAATDEQTTIRESEMQDTTTLETVRMDVHYARLNYYDVRNGLAPRKQADLDRLRARLDEAIARLAELENR